MKILFLDIDGVLNSRAYDCRRNWNGQTNIDETRLPLVKEIVEKTGAEIVLTSTWRRHLDGAMNACDEAGEYVVSTFSKHGLRIFSKTPDFGRGASRRDEVAAWLSEHDKTVETFVILATVRSDGGSFLLSISTQIRILATGWKRSML